MVFLYEALLILVLVIFSLSYLKLRINNRIQDLEHQNVITNNLIDTIDDGFYVWDAKKRIEKFSPNLLILLNTVFYSFNELVNFFEQSESLLQNFSEAKKINKSFTLDLKAQESEVYCMCYGRSIVDNSNNIIGVLLWIRNVSDYKIRANELELENKKFLCETENYKDILNSLPYPILKYDHQRKVKFYNSFYDKYINNAQKSAIMSYTAPIKLVVTCKNERKTFDFIKIPTCDPNNVIVYGKDISDTEKLHVSLSNYLTTQNNLLEGLSVAIAIYSKNQQLKFYNNSFIKTFQFDAVFLGSHPTYYEIMLHLYEEKKLLTKDDFQALTKQRHSLFKELLSPYNQILHLKNGKLLRVLTIPYTPEGLLFSYEEDRPLP